VGANDEGTRLIAGASPPTLDHSLEMLNVLNRRSGFRGPLERLTFDGRFLTRVMAALVPLLAALLAMCSHVSDIVRTGLGPIVQLF
jgi:hypothetical protein